MKILIHGRHFPVAMFRWFHWAFENLGHEVYTVGPYSAGTIPWGDFYYPSHKFPPNMVLPETNVYLPDVLKRIPFKPDFILQAGDSIWMEGPSSVPNYILATDPHVVDYTQRLLNADGYFYMHNYCKPEKAKWIPYAYDPDIHVKKKKPKKYDIVFCGLHYEHRVRAIEAFKKEGMKVFNALGLIYDDYADKYAEGTIAFNWSSKEDLPARFWEGLAMGKLVLTSRVPDLDLLEFEDGVDYVGFSSLEEAVEKAKFYLKNPKLSLQLSRSGYEKVKPHTYMKRAQEIIDNL